MAKNGNSNSGVGGTTVLVMIFVVLKLTHVINWSWWWVFSPYLIVAAIVLVALLVMGVSYYYTKANE